MMGSAYQPIELFRLLDAAANRAGEGLRAAEDYARFVLNDGHLSQLCKDNRHDLDQVVRPLMSRRDTVARDCPGDVGTEQTTAGEQRRIDPRDVAAANLVRAQQALRSLEEYAKLIDGDAARRLEQLRYQSYTLHKAIIITANSRDRLADVRLCVLIDGALWTDSQKPFAEFIKSLVAAGVGAIQLRDKGASDSRLLRLADALKCITGGTDTLFIVNDRPDIARLANADGVHLGQDDLAVRDVRRIVGAEMLVGVSTHNIEQARSAVLDGANYLGVGPMFASQTKQFAAFPGLDFARQIAAEIALPWFAIGGVTLDNLPDLQATGASRVACGAAITAAINPAEAARQMLNALAEHAPGAD